MSHRDTRRMLALLEQERRALQVSDLAQLQRLAPRKEATLARLERPNNADADGIRQVRQRAQRNARLFAALIDGIRDARHLIECARNGGRGKTYGRDGARAALDPPTGTLHRRA
jgi:flagellar biosynthesis/type III secretory pathway chaperone